MHDFVHLHLHTQCSLLDGASKIPDVIARVKELGQKACAITDHGVMYGAVDFYCEAKKQGIKPIIGCEVYTAARKMTDKTYEFDSSYGHLILLAENNEGYKNLVKIVSRAQLDGYYYKPRVDFDLLQKYSGGIIALSACMAGDIPRALLDGNTKKAEQLTEKFIAIYGKNNFFIELQNQGIAVQNSLNISLAALADKFGLGTVATNDAHYVNKSDAEIQDILMCIQMGKRLSDTDRMKFETNEFYIKSYDEMLAALPGYEQALLNTAIIAERCNVDFDFSKTYLPKFDTPDNTDAFSYLKKLCLDGMDAKYGKRTESLLERLNSELETIRQMGFVDYFLIVWDFVKFAKQSGIAVGPGRGSAAGSLTAYLLDITTVDPIKYDLLFERFLNPERVSMPDIDIDFCYERRGEVIDYVIRKYGADRVTQIVTFGTMAARQAVRDIGRVMDIPIPEVDRISKLIPRGPKVTLSSAMAESSDFKRAYDSDPKVKALVDKAMTIEGMYRNTSIHAAGVVIYKESADNYLPLQRQGDVITTQFTKENVEKLGLLKMDFLGLRNLTIIQDTVEIAAVSHGVKIDIEKINLNSPEIYRLLASGDTDGVFQLESGGMRKFLRELKPDCFEDVIAAISLYRPGPMASIPRYIYNRLHPEEVKYKHPLLKEILEPTYGCIVYQEQVMQIVRTLAGYSMGRADLVRRAMAKKYRDVLTKERRLFIYGGDGVDGALKRGVSESAANDIFDEIVDFAEYAFNKSHAAAYAVIACRTAWLKANYGAEFTASLVTAFLNDTSKVARYIDSCKKKGIHLLPPDINKSYGVFTTENGNIRFGLAAIKNIGRNMVDRIVSERNCGGAFIDLYDFIHRCSGTELNKRAVEALIKCGAFDNLGANRSQMAAVYEGWLDDVQMGNRSRVEGQLSLFGSEEDDRILPEIKEYSLADRLEMEHEYTGLYLTGNPLDEYKFAVKSNSDISIGTLISSEPAGGDTFQIAGIISRLRISTTKAGTKMAFADISDFDGTIGLVITPKPFSKYSADLKKGNVVSVKGKISIPDSGVPELNVFELKILNKIPVLGNIRIVIETDSDGIRAAADIFRGFRGGDTEVYIFNSDDGKWRALKGENSVFCTESLIKKLTIKYGSSFKTTKI
ncbi:MAG: DNA polymerase III subunit alpha [Clostridia bacterium]|nr:DNA polymerase III subunit alpha [Clostridia bacterium]